MGTRLQNLRHLSLLVAGSVPLLAVAAPEAPDMTRWVRAQHCLKCHAIDKEKQAPSYRAIAERLRAQPDGEARILTHLRSGREVKLADGHIVNHVVIDDASEATLQDVARWILSR